MLEYRVSLPDALSNCINTSGQFLVANQMFNPGLIGSCIVRHSTSH